MIGRVGWNNGLGDSAEDVLAAPSLLVQTVRQSQLELEVKTLKDELKKLGRYQNELRSSTDSFRQISFLKEENERQKQLYEERIRASITKTSQEQFQELLATLQYERDRQGSDVLDQLRRAEEERKDMEEAQRKKEQEWKTILDEKERQWKRENGLIQSRERSLLVDATSIREQIAEKQKTTDRELQQALRDLEVERTKRKHDEDRVVEVKSEMMRREEQFTTERRLMKEEISKLKHTIELNQRKSLEERLEKEREIIKWERIAGEYRDKSEAFQLQVEAIYDDKTKLRSELQEHVGKLEVVQESIHLKELQWREDTERKIQGRFSGEIEKLKQQCQFLREEKETYIQKLASAEKSITASRVQALEDQEKLRQQLETKYQTESSQQLEKSIAQLEERHKKDVEHRMEEHAARSRIELMKSIEQTSRSIKDSQQDYYTKKIESLHEEYGLKIQNLKKDFQDSQQNSIESERLMNDRVQRLVQTERDLKSALVLKESEFQRIRVLYDEVVLDKTSLVSSRWKRLTNDICSDESRHRRVISTDEIVSRASLFDVERFSKSVLRRELSRIANLEDECHRISDSSHQRIINMQSMIEALQDAVHSQNSHTSEISQSTQTINITRDAAIQESACVFSVGSQSFITLTKCQSSQTLCLETATADSGLQTSISPETKEVALFAEISQIIQLESSAQTLPIETIQPKLEIRDESVQMPEHQAFSCDASVDTSVLHEHVSQNPDTESHLVSEPQNGQKLHSSPMEIGVSGFGQAEGNNQSEILVEISLHPDTAAEQSAVEANETIPQIVLIEGCVPSDQIKSTNNQLLLNENDLVENKDECHSPPSSALGVCGEPRSSEEVMPQGGNMSPGLTCEVTEVLIVAASLETESRQLTEIPTPVVQIEGGVSLGPTPSPQVRIHGSMMDHDTESETESSVSEVSPPSKSDAHHIESDTDSVSSCANTNLRDSDDSPTAVMTVTNKPPEKVHCEETLMSPAVSVINTSATENRGTDCDDSKNRFGISHNTDVGFSTVSPIAPTISDSEGLNDASQRDLPLCGDGCRGGTTTAEGHPSQSPPFPGVDNCEHIPNVGCEIVPPIVESQLQFSESPTNPSPQQSPTVGDCAPNIVDLKTDTVQEPELTPALPKSTTLHSADEGEHSPNIENISHAEPLHLTTEGARNVQARNLHEVQEEPPIDNGAICVQGDIGASFPSSSTGEVNGSSSVDIDGKSFSPLSSADVKPKTRVKRKKDGGEEKVKKKKKKKAPTLESSEPSEALPTASANSLMASLEVPWKSLVKSDDDLPRGYTTEDLQNLESPSSANSPPIPTHKLLDKVIGRNTPPLAPRKASSPTPPAPLAKPPSLLSPPTRSSLESLRPLSPTLLRPLSPANSIQKLVALPIKENTSDFASSEDTTPRSKSDKKKALKEQFEKEQHELQQQRVNSVVGISAGRVSRGGFQMLVERCFLGD